MSTTLPKPRGSEWEEALLAHVTEHVNCEGELLVAYEDLAKDGPEYVRYLVELILEDESRHHRVFREMANRIRNDIEWSEVEPAVPYLHWNRADQARLAETTERFLSLERADAEALKELRKDVRDVRDTSLYDLLLRMMEYDTKKHIAMLEFIQARGKRFP